MTRVSVIVALFALTSCTPVTGDGSIVFALDRLALNRPMADPGTPMIDETGMAALDRFPAFLSARISAEDLESPVIGIWPEEVPEELPNEVTLDLLVPAGEARTVEVALLVADEDGDVSTWLAPSPGEAPLSTDVAEGEEVVLELEPELQQTGIIRASWTSTAAVEGVAFVDDALAVVLPTRAPVEGAVEASLALDRLYWPRVTLSDGAVLDLRDQSVALSEAGAVRELMLVIEE